MSSCCDVLPEVILIADAVPLLRRGLKQVLAQAFSDCQLHEATTAPELLELTGNLRPALVITAANLAGSPSEPTALLVALRKIDPSLAVIVLTDPVVTPDLLLLRLLRQSVSGLLNRTAPLEEVCETVSEVRKRGRYYNDYVLTLLHNQLNHRSKLRPVAIFSARQLEVLQLIAADHSNEEIADYLYTSVRTVEYHRSQMLQKAGTRTTLGLVLFALRQGLFSVDSRVELNSKVLA